MDMTYRSKTDRLQRLTGSVVVFFFLLFLLHCQIQEQPHSQYLILYAFDAEGQVLMEKMSIRETRTILGRPVISGELSGKNMVIAESGVGMTNAAMTAQRLIDEYRPGAIIFTGIAGAIDTSVHIGDIVACESWITHDYGYYGADGFQPGGIRSYSPRLDSLVRLSHFPVDSSMYVVAEDLTDEVSLPQEIGDRTPRLLAGGIGVSGNAFIDNPEKRIWLNETYNALITDMETAAVAQVCAVNDIPFIAFRSASDLAGGSGSESARAEMDEFFEIAAENSSNIVIRFLNSVE
jgi:adenosylhomocysteine nucleosidase